MVKNKLLKTPTYCMYSLQLKLIVTCTSKSLLKYYYNNLIGNKKTMLFNSRKITIHLNDVHVARPFKDITY